MYWRSLLSVFHSPWLYCCKLDRYNEVCLWRSKCPSLALNYRLVLLYTITLLFLHSVGKHFLYSVHIHMNISSLWFVCCNGWRTTCMYCIYVLLLSQCLLLFDTAEKALGSEIYVSDDESGFMTPSLSKSKQQNTDSKME